MPRNSEPAIALWLQSTRLSYIRRELIMRIVMSILYALLMAGCSEPDSAIVSERDFRSPDGRIVASLVEDTHFNTTGYDKHIGLRKIGERRPYPGNVWRFGPGDHVAIAWTSPTSVVVHYTYEVQRDGPPSTNLLGIAVAFERESLRKMIAEQHGRVEPEPADSRSDKSNVIGAWLPSLHHTFAMKPRFVADGEMRLKQSPEFQEKLRALRESIRVRYATEFSSSGFVRRCILRCRIAIELSPRAKPHHSFFAVALHFRHCLQDHT